jgi:CheY-like chemotaxis protein
MSEHVGRILAVDDVRENVRLLEAVLEAHGYDVVSATGAAPRSSSPCRRSPTSCCSTC